VATPLDIALTYIDRRWNPVPVEYRTKKPIGNAWQSRIIPGVGGSVPEVERAMIAAQSTVDALLYSLRHGVDALTRGDVQRRLGELDDKQMMEVAVLLQKRKLFPAWTEHEVAVLANVWKKLL
jgi:hypothetical protein